MPDPWYKTAFGPQYPLLYSHRNKSEAIKCIELFNGMVPLQSLDGRQCRILDLGCGDGRHLGSLHQNDHIIMGMDLSRPLLDLAAQKIELGAPMSLVQGDMGCLPFRNDSFSSVFSLFTAFGYFGPLIDNAHVIQEISRTLITGGHWFFDYFDCERVTEELGDRQEKSRCRVEGPLEIREVRKLNSRGDQVCKQVIMESRSGMEEDARRWGIPTGGLRYTEEVAVFSMIDLHELAGRFQLQPVASAGNYDGDPIGNGDRWLMVFRKTN